MGEVQAVLGSHLGNFLVTFSGFVYGIIISGSTHLCAITLSRNLVDHTSSLDDLFVDLRQILSLESFQIAQGLTGQPSRSRGKVDNEEDGEPRTEALFQVLALANAESAHTHRPGIGRRVCDRGLP